MKACFVAYIVNDAFLTIADSSYNFMGQITPHFPMPAIFSLGTPANAPSPS